jgi:hypothetical protein
MATYPNYRVYCTTEKKYIYTYSLNSPTTCPTDSTHVIDLSRVYEVISKINNFDAIVDPTINNDNMQGYYSGSLWINRTKNNVFICLDSSLNNAIWKDITTDDGQYKYNREQIDGHIDNLANPHQVTKIQLGLNNVLNLKYNFAAVSDPTNIDDIIVGYDIGSRWINTITDKEFVCVNNKEAGAQWVETTQPSGEINVGENIGTGEGLYATKFGSTLNFKSITMGDNITLSSTNAEINIAAKNTYSFLLCPTIVEAMDIILQPILYFPWLYTEYYNCKQGKIIFQVVIEDAGLDMVIYNQTEQSILGSLVDINNSGFYSLDIAAPSNNAQIQLKIRKNMINGVNPQIYGIVLKYET